MIQTLEGVIFTIYKLYYVLGLPMQLGSLILIWERWEGLAGCGWAGLGWAGPCSNKWVDSLTQFPYPKPHEPWTNSCFAESHCRPKQIHQSKGVGIFFFFFSIRDLVLKLTYTKNQLMSRPKNKE